MTSPDRSETAITTEDGTEPGDFAAYLSTLQAYYRAVLRQTPAEYLVRLARLVAEVERVLPALRRYAAPPPRAFAAAREELPERPRSYSRAMLQLCRAGVASSTTSPARPPARCTPTRGIPSRRWRW